MTTANNPNRSANYIKIEDLMRLCFARWHWFLLSLALSLFAAFIHIESNPPVYERRASVLIKEDTKGGSLSSANVSELSAIGLFQGNTNVNNEIVSFRAPGLMLDVARRLNLNVEYAIKGRFHDEVAYGKTLPVKVCFVASAATEGKEEREGRTCGFVIAIREGGEICLSDFTVDGEDCRGVGEITGRLSDTLSIPSGKIVVLPTEYYDETRGSCIRVGRTGFAAAAAHYSRNLTVGLNEEKTTIVDLLLKDTSPERAEDVLNTLIAIYNENWVRDKNRVAVNTSMFINERLNVIEQELGDVDKRIASFKSENLVPDVAAASAMYMSKSDKVADELQDLNNRLYMARYILRYMLDNGDEDGLLPAGSGIESGSIEQQIAEYNTIRLKRNNLMANSSGQNPLVVAMDRSLAAMHSALVASVESHIATLDGRMKSLRELERRTTSNISESPSQAKDLLAVERQQKVKEALYLFLLQKREENELSMAFAAHNTRIVQYPAGNPEPSAPVKRNILAVAFIIGLLLPVVVIFFRENLDTTVRGRKDMEGLSLPLIGEIPLIDRGKKSRFFLRKPHSPTAQEIVVEPYKRDVINEAFRVLRTNLEFITGSDARSNVIAVTSFNPGSGKSLMAVNIAASLVIKGKRTLVIDGDMRHASVSRTIGSPASGLSNLLNNGSEGREGRVNPKDFIVAHDRHAGLHILPVGAIPPNPTELLESGRLTEIISILREQYDYILIDCPPIDVVADAQIIEKQADRTIFVVRAGLLQRNMLPELEGFYTEKRFKNMVAVLNATSGTGGRYGYRYGYRGYYNA